VPKPGEDFVFGLQNREADQYQSLLRLHLVPLKNILLMISRRWPSARSEKSATPAVALQLSSPQSTMDAQRQS